MKIDVLVVRNGALEKLTLVADTGSEFARSCDMICGGYSVPRIGMSLEDGEHLIGVGKRSDESGAINVYLVSGSPVVGALVIFASDETAMPRSMTQKEMACFSVVEHPTSGKKILIAKKDTPQFNGAVS